MPYDTADPGKNKGIAFFEYEDPSVTDEAVDGLHGLDVCGRQLICERASKGREGVPMLQLGVLGKGAQPVQPAAVAPVQDVPMQDGGQAAQVEPECALHPHPAPPPPPGRAMLGFVSGGLVPATL